MAEETLNLFAQSQLAVWDYVVIVCYFISVLSVGIWSSWRSRKKNAENSDNVDQVGEYFLASRSMNFFLVGTSLFASNIGSEHFIGLAGSGAASGIAVGSYELNAIFILMLLGWFFVPVYLVSGVYTMPEYLRTRFGGQRIRVLLSCLALLAYVFTKISADLYAGALFIKLSVGLDGLGGLYISICILLALAAFFTMFGGVTAVIWTDFIQAILMIVGALILMGIAMAKVGGIGTIFDKYALAEADEEYSAFYFDAESGKNVSCGKVRPDFAHFFRDPTTGDIPWTGIFSGMVITSVWYWCTDQVIVQRTLASKNLSHAKAGCILAACLKLFPFFIIVIPGMIARVLWPNLVGCSNPEKCKEICGAEGGCSNISYILLVLRLLPDGLRGLILAVMLAALMSSLTSIFNSASTIFTMDIWKLIRKNATDIELIIIGRCTILVLVVISVLWIPVILSFKNPQLFSYIQAIQSYLSPPMTAVFIMAMLWHNMTEPGAFWGLLAGFGMGIIRFGMEFGAREPPCGSKDPDPRPEWLKLLVGNLSFLHFAPVSFVFTILVVLIVSLLTAKTRKIGPENLYRLTFWTRKMTEVRKPIDDLDAKDETVQQVDWKYKGLMYRMCCMAQEQEREEGKERGQKSERELIDESVALLKENKIWKWTCNVAAVLVMSAACFVWGFFA